MNSRSRTTRGVSGLEIDRIIRLESPSLSDAGLFSDIIRPYIRGKAILILDGNDNLSKVHFRQIGIDIVEGTDGMEDLSDYGTVFFITKGICRNSIDSIYRFATQNSDIYIMLISEENTDIPDYPAPIGSYDSSDVVFLIKEAGGELVELDTEEREVELQSGTHYSELLPVEYLPSAEYMEIYRASVEKYGRAVAKAVGMTAEKILRSRGKGLVLVSLARAGTPAGILIKRYLQSKYGLEIPHYCVSIIGGIGVDQNALKFIAHYHSDKEIQFIDGWTGKGYVKDVLEESVAEFKQRGSCPKGLSSELAVISDPAHSVRIYGTREDFLIPNACFNSIISGLLSRTAYREDLIGKRDFHMAKYYRELGYIDISISYIESIESHFKSVSEECELEVSGFELNGEAPDLSGRKEIESLMEEFGIEDINMVKPGTGESTRVLLRRVPWKILIKKDSKNIDHIVQLAKERSVDLENYPLKAYDCCGIVKNVF